MGILGHLPGQSSRLVNAVVDAIWPPRSLLSDARMDRPGAIEPDLWCALDFLGGSCCQHCGVPMVDATSPIVICPACLADPPDFDAARAVLAYDDISRRLVLDLKHGGRQDGLGTFGNWMANVLPLEWQVDPAKMESQPFIVPVPSHWTRMVQRGFNQAARLSAALAKSSRLGWYPGLLRRHRRTPSQHGKSVSGRDRNVRGAFAVDPAGMPKLTSARIILVDDVYTTGATVSACSRALKRAGASEILALTLCRVVKPVAPPLPEADTASL